VDQDAIEPLPVTLDTILNLEANATTDVTESDVFEKEKENEETPRLTLENVQDLVKSWNFRGGQDGLGNGPLHKVPSPAPARNGPPRRLSRQISLPSRLFTDLYNKAREKSPLAINFRLNRQESLSESYKIRLLFQLESLSMSSGEFGSQDFQSLNSSWESPSFPRNEPKVKDAVRNEGPFSSDLEKRALLGRRNRHARLIRQDTLSNFAPPDFCNET